MRQCVTGQQMQEIEGEMIHHVGIPAIVLMERAAMVVEEVVRNHARQSDHVWILCGMGNNGADGIATGRMLFQKGYGVEIITIGDEQKATEEYRTQERIARNIGVTFTWWKDWDMSLVQPSDWFVDGVFGIGLSRPVGGDYRTLMEQIQDSVCKNIIAIDIPSGICASTGSVLGCALQATVTVTFGYEKLGLYLGDGRSYSGQIVVADIGIGQVYENGVCILEDKDCERLPKRAVNSNKGTYGKLLIIAGSEGMSGAAYLSALGAYRTGAGLVQILTVESNRSILQSQLPEAIIKGYSQMNGKRQATEACAWATAIVMGPGLGQGDEVKKLVELVLAEAMERSIPIVIDADGLNTIAFNEDLTKYCGPHMVITPHLKEMSRLAHCDIPELKYNAVSAAQAYCRRYQVSCIMKDCVSVIAGANGDTYLNMSGNSALAKGGTGDVLSGIVGGLLCLGMEQTEAAAYAAYLHGRAGSRASREMGMHGVLASDIVKYLW